jgi:nucleotide-binding universal stress UspA family protein
VTTAYYAWDKQKDRQAGRRATMFTRILVPLDGTPRAERALAVAARIARASHGSIVLLQAIGVPFEYGTYVYGSYVTQTPMLAQEALDAEQAKAQAYLTIVQQSEKLAGIPVETKVQVGTAAATIEDLANEEKIDLIVMCSHGDTGFKRWVLGSVAQKVGRHSHIPVLVLNQAGTQPDSPFPDRLRPLRSIRAMVALDGSPFAEAAIEPAAALVAALSAPAQGTLLLTKVMPFSAIGRAPDAKSRAQDEAQTYLNNVAQKYAWLTRQYRVALSTSLATGREVAGALIRAAEEGEEAGGKRLTGGCDLIAMTTHGRSGLQRVTMGSVTEGILGATTLPLLIVHNVGV